MFNTMSLFALMRGGIVSVHHTHHVTSDLSSRPSSRSTTAWSETPQHHRAITLDLSAVKVLKYIPYSLNWIFSLFLKEKKPAEFFRMDLNVIKLC